MPGTLQRGVKIGRCFPPQGGQFWALFNSLQLKDKWRVALTWYIEFPTAGSVRALHHTPADAALGF